MGENVFNYIIIRSIEKNLQTLKNEKNEIHTPVPDSFLDGITRRCVIDIAKSKGIKIVEDCAQSYGGMDFYKKQNNTHLSMFSFGSIKSITALGCAIGFTTNDKLYSDLKEGFLKYDRIVNSRFRSKVLKYFLLKILSQPLIYGIFIAICKLLNIDYDKAIISTVRNFPSDELLRSIRMYPSNSQLKYLLYYK